MFNWEKIIIDYLKKHWLLLLFLFVTIIALLVRYSMRDFESGDYLTFLHPWFEELKLNGGFKALSNYPGDYNSPYMTIMAILTYLPINELYSLKIVSCIFDFLLAISVGLLVRYLVKNNKDVLSFIAYTLTLFMPSVLLNSGMWCQCDSIYATFVVLAFLYLFKEKYVRSFIFLGIAFSFKLQFIFILPIYIVLYVCNEKFSIINFLIIPLMNFILSLPAIIAGKPIIDCLMVYFKQTNTYKTSLTLNFPNIYNLISGDVAIFYKVGEMISILICALMLGYILYKKVKWNNERIFTLTIWFMVILTFVLPGMHERYLFVGEVLTLTYYIIYQKNLPLLIFMNISVIITYSSFLGGLSFDYLPLMSIIYTIIIVYFTKDTLKLLEEKDN